MLITELINLIKSPNSSGRLWLDVFVLTYKQQLWNKIHCQINAVVQTAKSLLMCHCSNACLSMNLCTGWTFQNDKRPCLLLLRSVRSSENLKNSFQVRLKFLITLGSKTCLRKHICPYALRTSIWFFFRWFLCSRVGCFPFHFCEGNFSWTLMHQYQIATMS